MKRLSFVFLLLTLLAFGCSGSRLELDSYVSGQDSQYMYFDTEDGSVTETKDSYYFLSGPDRCFLYLYDKTTKLALPVCNKPDCLHTDEPDNTKIAKCNAFLGIWVSHLKLYQNNLYYIIYEESENNAFLSLYQISLDGTKRRRVHVFKEFFSSIQIHRGYIYYSTTDSGTISGQEATTKTTYKLCRLALDKSNAEPEVIEQGTGIYGVIDNLFAYGNNIYYTIYYKNDDTLSTYTSYVNRYDILTNTASRFLASDSSHYTVLNGQFVYMIYKQGTYTCDMDGKNPKKICDGYGLYTSNDNFLFIDNWYSAALGLEDRKLTIINRELNMVKTVPMTGLKKMPLGCSGEYYFLPSVGVPGNEHGEKTAISCVPVGKLTDDMRPAIFYEFVPKVAFNGIVTGR